MAARLFVQLSLALYFLSALTACSTLRESATPASSTMSLHASGSVLLAKPLPEISIPEPTRLLGFLPFYAAQTGKWLSISKAKDSIRLMEGNEVVLETSGEGIDYMPNGVFQVLHKQRNALWYAPDEYFTKRKMDIPPPGDRARFRRGALGSFVLFIDKNTRIHSGPLWSNEIGGIKLSDQDLSRIYYQLDLGSVVEVKAE